MQGLGEGSITGLDGLWCAKHDFPPATCYVCFDSEKKPKHTQHDLFVFIVMALS